MSRLKQIIDLVSHYKYAITIILGVLIVGFVDEYSFRRRVELQMQISDLQDEIDKYNAQNESDLRQLRDMRSGSATFERIARERYFMHADDEDIFVLSDDEKPKTSNDETVE